MEKRRAHECRPTRSREHVWGPFFATSEDGDYHWTKFHAHTTATKLANGKGRLWQKKGSDTADKYAKKAPRRIGNQERRGSSTKGRWASSVRRGPSNLRLKPGWSLLESWETLRSSTNPAS